MFHAPVLHGEKMLRPPKRDLAEIMAANKKFENHPLMKLLGKAPRWLRTEYGPPNPEQGTLERRPELIPATGNALRAVFSDEDMEERKRLAKEAAKDFIVAQVRNYINEKQIYPALERDVERQIEARKKRQQRLRPSTPPSPIRTPEEAAKTLVPKRLPPEKGGIPFINSASRTSSQKLPGLSYPILDLALRSWDLSQNPPPALQRIPTATQNAGVDEFGMPIPQQLNISMHRGNPEDPAWKRIADYFGVRF